MELDSNIVEAPAPSHVVTIDLTEARILISRWKLMQLSYSLVLEQDAQEGIFLLLRQDAKWFKIATASGRPKNFLYTKSLGRTIDSLFPNGVPECEIAYQHHD